MGSSNLSGSLLIPLLIVTAVAELGLFLFFGTDVLGEFEDVNTDGFDLLQMFDALGALFGLVLGFPEGFPVAASIVWLFLIDIPWFLILAQLIISLVPFT